MTEKEDLFESEEIKIYPKSTYTYGGEKKQPNEDKKSHIDKIIENFEDKTGSISLRFVILAHEHEHPYILMLKNKKTSEKKLVGGLKKRDEDPMTCATRIINKKLGCHVENVQIRKLLSTWYRPHIGELWYPYKPVHIVTEKEHEMWILVSINKSLKFSVKDKYEVVFYPFYDLLDDQVYFDPRIRSIPIQMSSFKLVYEN